MSLFSKIRGTIETLFQIGIGGPQLKNNGGNIDARDDTDAAYVNVRGATPVGVDDLTTKAYVDGIVSGAAGSVREIRYVIGTGASQASATSIPANAYVISCEVEITTPYSNGTAISVGRTLSTSLIMTTSENNPEGAIGDIYQKDQDTPWGGAALPVLTTITGGPGVGAGVVIVRYTEPNL